MGNLFYYYYCYLFFFMYLQETIYMTGIGVIYYGGEAAIKVVIYQ